MRRLFSILIVNTIALLAVFLLFEVYCRLMKVPFRTTGTAWENAYAGFDRELGWSYIPSRTIRQEPGGREVLYSFNRDGIRTPHEKTVFDPGRPTILFIGGSFTMGHGLNYGDSFVGQFDRAQGGQYQVVNLGVQAYGTDQAFLALKRFLPRYDTQWVVYTFIEDHVRRNANYDRRMILPEGRFLGTKPLFRLGRNGELSLARKPLLYEEYVHSWLLDAIVLSLRNAKVLPQPEPYDLTLALVKAMDRYCSDNSARFVVLHWRWEEDRTSKATAFADALRAEGILSIDLLESAPAGWGAMQLPEDKHPDAEAGAHASRVLMEYVFGRPAERLPQ